MVSVVMCTYNGERFLNEQLSSIRSQTSPPSEMVIADDGSTDGTLRVVECFAADAPFPVTIVRNVVRQGPTKNFERAASRVTGDIIFFADQDDIWEAQKIAAMTAVFHNDASADMVISDGRCIDSSGRSLPYTLFDCVGRGAICKFANRASSQFNVLLQRDIVTGAACCIRTRLLQTCTPFPRTWVHDAWLAFAAARENGILVLPAALIRYRLHPRQQVGVRPHWSIPTKIADRSDRQARLQSFVDLRSFWGTSLSGDQRKELDGKIAHMRFRASLPVGFCRRTLKVVQRSLCGHYHRYSLGFRSVALDLFSPSQQIPLDQNSTCGS